jgi:LAS superfamily LD-carboxypeptidase LdcB
MRPSHSMGSQLGLKPRLRRPRSRNINPLYQRHLLLTTMRVVEGQAHSNRRGLAPPARLPHTKGSSTASAKPPGDRFSSAHLAHLLEPTEDRFMRQVYDRQVATALKRGFTYTAGASDTELRALPDACVRPGRRVAVRRDVYGDVTSMIGDAGTALQAAQREGIPGSTEVTDLRVLSGYRSAREQFFIWQREYPRYYRDTQAVRRGLPGGEHGGRAVDYLADYIGLRVFCPGYSSHQYGRTVDLTYQAHQRWSAADTTATAIELWLATWCYTWLQDHAHAYGFAQRPELNEPWHWEHQAR